MSIKVSITGERGFVGKTLITQLTQKKGFELVEQPAFNSNISSVDELLIAYKECDVIVHLASKTFVPHSFESPFEFYTNNINSSLSIIELCRIKQIKLLFMSSYVYGEPTYFPIDEKHTITPHNPYAHSKIIAEELCKYYGVFFKLKYTILRPFNIYGVHQPDHFLVSKIIQLSRTGKIVLDDPRPKRDYINVIDLSETIIRIITADEFKGEIFNVCSGESTSIEQIINAVQKSAAYSFDVEYTHKQRPNEILDIVGDNSKIRKALNWAPEHNIIDDIPHLLNQANG